MRLLALDTATELCSAALWIDGAVTQREAWAPREHAALILPMIEQLLRERQLGGEQLDAIAFGRGPGAFTGVRLAVAVAQGLAYAWGRPLIPVSDLQALAAGAVSALDATRVLVCQDARMQEVYWGCFERRAGHPWRLCSDESVGAPEGVLMPQEWRDSELAVIGAGSGFGVYAALQNRFAGQLRGLMPDLRPQARHIAALAAEQGLSAALAPEQAQPVYLRDRVTSPSSN